MHSIRWCAEDGDRKAGACFLAPLLPIHIPGCMGALFSMVYIIEIYHLLLLVISQTGSLTAFISLCVTATLDINMLKH